MLHLYNFIEIEGVSKHRREGFPWQKTLSKSS